MDISNIRNSNKLFARLEGDTIVLGGKRCPELFYFNTHIYSRFWYNHSINGKLWNQVDVPNITFSNVTLNLQTCFLGKSPDALLVESLIKYGPYRKIVFEKLTINGSREERTQFANNIIILLRECEREPFFYLDLKLSNVESYEKGIFLPEKCSSPKHHSLLSEYEVVQEVSS